jgi:hypothetical protein
MPDPVPVPDPAPASDPDLQARRDWAVAARDLLAAGLDRVLGDGFRKDVPRPRDGAGWIDVTSYDLTGPCPARWAHPGREDDYLDSAANAARRLGRLTLRARRPGRPVADTVHEVLSDTDALDGHLRDWFEGLDRAGRATVAAAAGTWAVGALGAVRGRDDLQWATQNQPVDVPGRTVRLRANWDAIAGRRSRPAAALVMSGAVPDPARDDLVAGFTALVVGLGPGVVPERVRFGSAAAGTARAVVIAPDLLTAAVDRVLELVDLRARPDDAPERPGRWCGSCHLLESCSVGQAASTRRVT